MHAKSNAKSTDKITCLALKAAALTSECHVGLQQVDGEVLHEVRVHGTSARHKMKHKVLVHGTNAYKVYLQAEHCASKLTR